MKNRRPGFTLIEILVVLGIIALLAALLFPAFNRARENGRQASCNSNLHQIYLAVTQYKRDEGRYPGTMVDLLGEGSQFTDITGTAAVLDGKAAGYLKGGQDSLTCPDDDTNATLPRSSYGILTPQQATTAIPAPTTPTTFTGDASQYVWNFWGYQDTGFAYPTDVLAKAAVGTGCTSTPCPYLSNPNLDFDKDRNPVKFSLANRFAPPSTIITHCIYHRTPTATNINNPVEMYTTPSDSYNARDIVLRLDGSAKSVDISLWGPTTPPTPATPTLWQKQTE